MDDSPIVNPTTDAVASPSIQVPREGGSGAATGAPPGDGTADSSTEVRRFSGAILAGGRSTRMGCDKALLMLDGESLLQRHVRLLRAAGAREILLNQHPERARPTTAFPPDVRLVWDDPTQPEAGPLGGLAAVLAAAETPWIAVSAVDLPHLTVTWWRGLLAACTGETGVVGQRPDGCFEPLAAIYPCRALTPVRRRLVAREYALQSLIREGLTDGWMCAWPMTVPDLATLHNWNAPTDRQG